MTRQAASATAVAVTPAVAAVPSGDASAAALVPLARLLGRAAARAWLIEGADNDNANDGDDNDDGNNDTDEAGIPAAG